MKVLNLCFADMAGAGYTLAHALNKRKDVQAINIRANNNYIDYPTIAEMRYYREETCRQMVYSADVVVFHTAIKPFFSGLHLDAAQLKDKKKLLYFHGSDVRTYGKDIVKQAEEMFGVGGYETLVSTPDLLRLIPTGVWMPVARPIDEIKRVYGMCGQDHRALKAFDGDIRKVVVTHAPTSQERKGSALFFRIITELILNNPLVEYQVVQNFTWDQCLRVMARTNVYYDQHVIGAYGLAAIEASIFRAAVFCRLDPDVIEIMEREFPTVKNPFIQWADDDDLRSKSKLLTENPSLARKFGTKGYEYAKTVHDEKPVADRFMKVVEGMD